MDQFTPGSALAGGALIGAATSWLLVADGRIAGVSGILGGALRRGARGDRLWRIAFLLGLPAGFLLEGWLAGAPPVVRVVSSPAQLAAAGVLVGFGTRLGSGCTSGHGICGLSRASPRSIAATAIFMALGFATVFAWRHLLGGAR